MTRTKRVIAMAAALVLTMALAVPALALGEIDAAQAGSIVVKVQEGEDNAAFRDDLADATVKAAVYQVATVNEYGAFALTDDFLSLQDNASWRGGILNGDTQMKELLEAALKLVQPAEPAEGETPAEPAIKPLDTGTEAVAVINGPIALPEGQNQGLFLVIPEKVETTLWVYEFNPALLAVPSIERATEQNGLDEDQWQYTVPMYLKGDRERQLMDLEIEKYLEHYNRNLGPTTFVFDVVGRIDGQVVFQSTAQVTFGDDSGRMEKAVVHNIPAGAEVTVTEVYTGGKDDNHSYTNTDGTVKVVTVEPGTLPAGQDVHRVDFTNDYTGGRVPDASVENVFTATEDSDGNIRWEWHKSGEEAES